jgi:hypothetical protein
VPSAFSPAIFHAIHAIDGIEGAPDEQLAIALRDN